MANSRIYHTPQLEVLISTLAPTQVRYTVKYDFVFEKELLGYSFQDSFRLYDDGDNELTTDWGGNSSPFIATARKINGKTNYAVPREISHITAPGGSVGENVKALLTVSRTTPNADAIDSKFTGLIQLDPS